jgi:hypothetical protein
VLHRSRLHATPRTASRSPCHASPPRPSPPLTSPRQVQSHKSRANRTRIWRQCSRINRRVYLVAMDRWRR